MHVTTRVNILVVATKKQTNGHSEVQEKVQICSRYEEGSWEGAHYSVLVQIAFMQTEECGHMVLKPTPNVI